ncbi:mannitol operon transcriptional antiterminator [Salirhabdus euzebyi]|uniref:Mannitol operon transcriptional antiterminator n=1 Tax=Salirhabdus euzebyi TaxID=394506 RepID=A0A841Q5V8_9BACI|nr:BglG family transcription antiterminator [Salirhabdus euzebyi]MBB6453702.1 mannitol operon transcriptional antiterminator [Salirhabdus euzebyi]
MTLDQRSAAVLTHLIHADSYLSIKELTERLNVSRRTIYYDLEKINYWLEQQGLSIVEQVRSVGLILDEETKKLIPSKLGEIKAWHYELSATERFAWIAIYLFASEKALYLEQLMEKVRVSRNTTIEDIKTLKMEMLKFDLELDFDRKTGYVIRGNESDIRKAIVYFLSLAVPEENWESLISDMQMLLKSYNQMDEEENLFSVDDLKAVYRVISESEKVLNIEFTDDVLHSLSLRFVLFSKRVAQGKYVEMDTIEKEVLRDTKEFKAARFISERLTELFHIPYSEDEELYITTHLLSAKVNYSDEVILTHAVPTDLRTVAEHIVDDFQKHACVLFQNRDLLVKNLLIHLKPAYYRIKYGLEVQNQLVESIKTRYPEIFSLTKKVVHHFEKIIGKPVHENEIAYIAIHFGGWMRREGTEPASRKRVLLVCANGVGTSQILKQQLEGLFSTIDIVGTASVREFERKEYDVDFIISTTPVSKKDLPVFIVSPILTDSEKEGLLKKVNSLFHHTRQQAYSVDGLMDLIQRHASVHDQAKLYDDLKQYLTRTPITKKQIKPSLTELITIDTIQMIHSVKDWKEAIRVASSPLIKNDSITDRYIEEMISNVEKLGPYIVIAPKIAIPHAKPEHGVQKLGMSLLRLEKSVAFSDQQKHDVHFVVVLAAIDNETHLKALSQFTRLMSNPSTIENMLQACSKEELFSYIEKTIQTDEINN